jgi:hypothetical protein
MGRENKSVNPLLWGAVLVISGFIGYVARKKEAGARNSDEHQLDTKK